MAQNPTLQAPAPMLPTQTCTWAPDTFNGSNLEDLWAFLLQCQIMFNVHHQNFTSESAKVFFAISYLKKSALEWFEQGILEDDSTLRPWNGGPVGQNSSKSSGPTSDPPTQ